MLALFYTCIHLRPHCVQPHDDYLIVCGMTKKIDLLVFTMKEGPTKPPQYKDVHYKNILLKVS